MGNDKALNFEFIERADDVARRRKRRASLRVAVPGSFRGSSQQRTFLSGCSNPVARLTLAAHSNRVRLLPDAQILQLGCHK